jgi:hypothetical protein
MQIAADIATCMDSTELVMPSAEARKKPPAKKKPPKKKPPAKKRPAGGGKKPPKKPPKGPPRGRGGGGGGDDPEHRQRLADIHARIDRGLTEADLSDERQREYQTAIRSVVERLTPGAVRRLHANGREYRFYSSWTELTAAVRRKYPGLVIPEGRVLKGMFDRDGTLHLDGGGDYHGRPDVPVKEFQAHEVTHAIDGTDHELSNSDGWRKAWEAEIRDGGFLGPNSTRSPTEGWGDFGMMVLGTDISVTDTQAVMPRCVSFWRDNSLL